MSEFGDVLQHSEGWLMIVFSDQMGTVDGIRIDGDGCREDFATCSSRMRKVGRLPFRPSPIIEAIEKKGD